MKIEAGTNHCCRWMAGGLILGIILFLLGKPAERPSLASLSAWADASISEDNFGGLLAIRSPNGGTGFFRLERFGNRWMFVTPEGHGFWFLGVALVESGAPGKDDSGRKYGDYVQTKYGTSAVWAVVSKQRLLDWGFNALGMYESSYVRAYGCYGRRPSPPLLPHFSLHTRFADASLRNIGGFLGSPVKNLLWMLPGGGVFPDIFDPGFRDYAFWSMKQSVATGGLDTEINSPWVIGYLIDETDDLRGFGPARAHKHLGWSALCTPPYQPEGVYGMKRTYKDARVYTKFELQKFLKNRYVGNLAALNAAWHSSYTSWDSDGGYGTGNGLLDEDGKDHSWVGDCRSLDGATGPFKVDLDDFLYLMAKEYFKVCHDAIRSVDKNHLIFGPASVSDETRPQVLLAGRDYVDVFVANLWCLDSHTAAYKPSAAIHDLTGRPVLAGNHFLEAIPDSPLAVFYAPGKHHESYDTASFETQEQRGQAYEKFLVDLLELRGTDDVHPIVGFQWWALVDNWREKRNFGLVTIRDNAYDGKEATAERGIDARAYPVGGERRDYGDFISLVRRANREVLSKLIETVQAAVSESPKGANGRH